MNRIQWLTCNDPRRMLAYLLEYGRPNERKLRLWACACCRYYFYLPFVSRRALEAVEAAERFADGEIDDKGRGLALNASNNIEDSTERLPAQACLRADIRAGVVQINNCYNTHLDFVFHAELLREVFGNHPLNNYLGYWDELRAQCCLDWRGGLLSNMAADIYQRRDWAAMPVLADALEDAGCSHQEIVQHCRGLRRCPGCSLVGEERSGWCELCHRHTAELSWVRTGPHVRGCWVLDLLMGKS